MEINATVGPCWLQLYSLCVCLLNYSRTRSCVDGNHVEGSPCYSCVIVEVCPLCGDGLSECRAFQLVGEMYLSTLSYITLLDGGTGKKLKEKRKEPVFHPISLERQCCALVIV